MVSYHPAKFGGHKHSGSKIIMNFACKMTLQGCTIKALYGFMVRNPLR